jgi:class 3 adenylate cyclase
MREPVKTPDPTQPPAQGRSGSGEWDSVDPQAESQRFRRNLVRTMRHDLRTPINHVIGYAQLLLEESPPETAASWLLDLERIVAAGRDALTIVDHSLDASVVERGWVDWERFRNDMRKPLDALVAYGALAEEEAPFPAALADIQKIRSAAQRLGELVSAAVELTKTAAGTAEDAGPLSLSMARQPLGNPRSEAPVRFEGKVLVVDDNEANRHLIARRLERLGLSTTLSADGESALRTMAEESFDLVLLDVLMPGMTGIDVLRTLKADRALRHIPVIVLSAFDEIGYVAACVELGAEDYLPKPFDPVLLRARVGASLEKKRLRDREGEYLRGIEDERRRYEELLQVILPHEIVKELRATNQVRPRRYEDVAVLFCDIVGFTAFCEKNSAQEVISNLQMLVEAYEEAALRHDLQKIKTVGDSFMAAGGLLKQIDNAVLACVRCGEEMIAVAEKLPAKWQVRVGIHVGPVVAGVIGSRQYLFDLWGDTVNTAARMESHGHAGSVTLSKVAWERISHHCEGESLGVLDVKGKGKMEMMRLLALRPPPDVVDSGRIGEG